jgi:hypothetical protein
MRRLLVTAFALFALQGTVLAAGDLSQATMGEHWYGPKRTLEGLKGHVVLWENWGYN